VNNLHQICVAVVCGAGRYSGDIYEVGKWHLHKQNTN
jgi:hypothetical protein